MSAAWSIVAAIAVRRPADWRCVKSRLARIDRGSALDQNFRRGERIVGRRAMQRPLAVGVADVRRHAQIEQQRHDVGAILLRGRKHRVGQLSEIRMFLE
jgi:hypothetical protein